jgi:hypothetical protein
MRMGLLIVGTMRQRGDVPPVPENWLHPAGPLNEPRETTTNMVPNMGRIAASADCVMISMRRRGAGELLGGLGSTPTA